MTDPGTSARARLLQIARRVMKECGFLPDFSQPVLDELEKLRPAGRSLNDEAKDLRRLPWASIDNDDSRDLDQLTVAEKMAGSRVKILVAVADVDSLVKKNSAIDGHARHNTTSVYAAGNIFPMLPERLSTDLTSLNYQQDQPAMVVEMLINGAGEITGSDIYHATVRNHAKLAYNAVSAWLGGTGPGPDKNNAVSPVLAENLRLQDRVAQKLRARRYERGTLDLQTIESRPVFAGDEVRDMQADVMNRARQLIEDFMIAANDVTARFLHQEGVPSIRRVVRKPKRWSRIVDIAAQHGARLPAEADSKALALFLAERKAADPVRFPDLSLVIIKLLGSGEYVLELAGETVPGHFGLAMEDYAHSTAPNRRFPDLITQRILKAALSGEATPYSQPELAQLAGHCTEKEDDARKVERRIVKSAAAILLSSKIGELFEGICTGAAAKGTWVRIFRPPIEGRLLEGYEGVDVGDRLMVKLIHLDVEKGFIDFEKMPGSSAALSKTP